MDKVKSVYLLGIGGIGMSALARYFSQRGKKVAGYDRYRSSLCEQLESEGMKIHYQDNPAHIPKFVKPEHSLIIYTPALPSELEELDHLRSAGFKVEKRATVLGHIASRHRCLAIAGTHGKTTTSALLAHILRKAGVPSEAFLGGIATNYNSNYWGHPDAELLVVEADEYDRSFLQLHPACAAITSTDADHLDIYESAEGLRNTFQEFSASVQEKLWIREGLSISGGEPYGFGPGLRYRAENLRVEDHATVFDLHLPGQRIENIRSGIPGRYNVENTIAAASIAHQIGLSETDLRTGIESFKGVKRRFEYHVNTSQTVYIDDYAHHPQEIQALIQAVRQHYPGRPITAIFQPHLYSRTRDFMQGFAEALSNVDELILMEIYPAREKPIPGITASALLEAVHGPKTSLLGRQEILTRFSQEKPKLLLTMGAGDIDQLVQSLKMTLLR